MKTLFLIAGTVLAMLVAVFMVWLACQFWLINGI